MIQIFCPLLVHWSGLRNHEGANTFVYVAVYKDITRAAYVRHCLERMVVQFMWPSRALQPVSCRSLTLSLIQNPYVSRNVAELVLLRRFSRRLPSPRIGQRTTSNRLVCDDSGWGKRWEFDEGAPLPTDLHVPHGTLVSVVDHLFEPKALVQHPHDDQPLLVACRQLRVRCVPGDTHL